MNAPATPARGFDADLSGRVLDVRLLRRLLRWLAPERRRLGISALLVLASSMLQVLLPIVLSLVVIDQVLLGNSAGNVPDLGMVALTEWIAGASGAPMLVAACALYAMLHIAMAITGHLHRVTLADAVIRGLTDLRQAVFDHLLYLPAAFWDRVAVGRVTTRVSNDVEALYDLLRSLGSLIGEFVPFFVALAIMLALDPGVTGLLLCFAPVLAVMTFLFRRVTRRLYRAVRQSLSRLNQNMQENLSGLTVVQLHGREDQNLEQYRAINSDNRRQENRATFFETSYAALNDSLGSLALALVIWAGGQAVAMDTLTLGAVVLFTRYIDMLFQPIVALGEQYNLLFRAMASGERIFQALDWREPQQLPERPLPLPPRLAGDVRIQDLHFRYGNGPEVLHGIDLHVPAGTTLAIVGPTGSGKSTLVRLLPRLYEVPAGHIFVDGMDVTELDARALRRRIGFVLQDFHVFSGSILDNITLGNADISRDDAIAAARLVGADRFIEALPLGYDAPLSERGRNLSQGQRQLLAFARTLAADPSLLILDEATANIDPETEALIQAALTKVTENRTAIIIAHRLRTIRDADQVLVLVNGRVEAIGNHAALLTTSPTYARLHSMQFGATATPS